MVLGCCLLRKIGIVAVGGLLLIGCLVGSVEPMEATSKLTAELVVAPGLRSSPTKADGIWQQAALKWESFDSQWALGLELIGDGDGKSTGQLTRWRGSATASYINPESGRGGGVRVFHGRPHFSTSDLLQLVERGRYSDDGSGLVVFGKGKTAQLTGVYVDTVANIGDDGFLGLLEGSWEREPVRLLVDLIHLQSQPRWHALASQPGYWTSMQQSLASLQVGYGAKGWPFELEAQIAGVYTHRLERTYRYRGTDGAIALEIAANPRSRVASLGGVMKACITSDGFRSALGSRVTAEGANMACDGRLYWRPTDTLRLQSYLSFDGRQTALDLETWKRYRWGDLRITLGSSGYQLSGRVRPEKFFLSRIEGTLQYRPDSDYWRLHYDLTARDGGQYVVDLRGDALRQRIGFGLLWGSSWWEGMYKWGRDLEGVWRICLERQWGIGSFSVGYGYDDRGRLDVGWGYPPRVELSYTLRY